MAGKNSNLCIFFTLFLISSVFCSKLNVPRVLLPIFSDLSTQFILEAIEGGCYKWTTTRNDIIKITPIDENKDYHCSSKIQVSTITKEEQRNLAVVLAQDVHTDQILKCDVIVDVIHSLAIQTTTRELFMDEVPVAFELNAYDVQGNEFSTLEGIEFDWTIISNTKKDVEILRYLPFGDSPYEAQASIKKLEESNKKGSIILLEGVKTGTAKVSVRLPYPYYKHVESVEATLSVIANLLLTPGEIYMMAGDTANFKLFYMNSGRLDEIALPDKEYYLKAESDVISIDAKTNEITAVKLGKAYVLVQNSYSKEDDPAIKLPSAVINVVEPSYMVINILPHKNWAILMGDQHEIQVDVFSASDHKLYMGPGVPIHVQIGDGFHVEERTQNGSWLSGWGLRESRAHVLASLDGVIHPTRGKINLPRAIRAEAEMLIYSRIFITPSEVILPWDPQVKPKYTVELIAKGGDGRFLWTSTDHSIGLVTQAGVVRTLNKGYFDISAAMMRNHHNRQVVQFSILPPVKLEIIEYIMDAELGESIHLHIALYTQKYEGDNTSFVPVTQCQNLPFQLTLSDTKFYFNKTEVIPPVGVSCGNLALVAKEVGSTKVTVVYHQDGKDLEDSVTVTAHRPLKLLQPEKTVVLAVGSTINLLYTGGPRPIIGYQSDHHRLAISQDDEIIQSEDMTERHELPEEDSTVVWVLCKKLGETSVSLEISNTPPFPNCRSHGSKIVTQIICGKPRDIQIEPKISVADPSACPMDLSGDRIVVPVNKPIALNIFVRDEIGRIFLNTTSLLFTWEANPLKSATFQIEDGTLVRVGKIGTVEIIEGNEQIVTTLEEKGLIEITGTVMGYQDKVLKHFKITPEFPEFLSDGETAEDINPVAATVGLFLVEDTVVTPNSTVVFNQPGNKKYINVLHGSGFIQVSLNAENIVDVSYIEGTRQIEIVPMTSGDVVIEVRDLCVSSEPSYVQARVVSVSRIEVETLDKVQINHCIDVIVRLYDETDQLLNVSEIDDLSIRHRLTENIANLGLKEDKDEVVPLGELHYILAGMEVGETVLTFSYDSTPQQVLSSPYDVQVFAPLTLNPRNVTLLMGAKLQLTVKGGPSPSNIEFKSHSASTTECSTTGVIVGKGLGSTKITARAISLHPRTGDLIVYTEDTVEVSVIKITGIKIAAPLTKFKVGSSAPFWVTGIPEQLTPLILATFEDSSLLFDWSLSDNYLASQNGVFAPVGVTYKSEDRTITRITGLQAGKMTLTVNVTVLGEKSKKKLSAFVDLEVIEGFELTHPMGLPGRPLLMSRESKLQLSTNLDNLNNIQYVLIGNESLVSITDDGLLTSYSDIGMCMLVVTGTNDEGLVQTLTFVIEVKPVHYMMMIVISNWRIHLDSTLRVLPLGSDFDLLPQFFDNLGNLFNAGPTKVKATTNRLDLIKIKHSSTNTSLQISTRRPGHTVVKAWTDGFDNTADYIRIHAEEVVKPIVESLTTGDIICLYSPVVTKHLQIGHWESGDSNIINIVKDIGYVVGSTEAVVFVTHPLHAHAPLRLQVLPISEIALYAETPFITNGPAETESIVGVVFKNEQSPREKRTNLVQGWHCDRNFLTGTSPAPFSCHIEFSDSCANFEANLLYTLEGIFRQDVGQYQCILTSTGANASEASTIQSNLTVWVQLENIHDDLSQRLEIPFIPNVYVEPEVLIDDDKHAGEFEIKGLESVLNQIIVEPADSSILFVDFGRFVDKTRKKYSVTLIDYHRKLANQEETMGIIITSPINKQVIKIMVKVSDDFLDDTCSAYNSPIYRFFVLYKHSIIIVMSMIVIFIVTCFVYSSYMQPMVNVNVHPNRSLLATGTTGTMNMHRANAPFSSTPCQANVTLLRQSPTSPIRMSPNCSCGNRNQHPQTSLCYGGNNTTTNMCSFNNTSPELRRNRRFL